MMDGFLFNEWKIESKKVYITVRYIFLADIFSSSSSSSNASKHKQKTKTLKLRV